MICCACQVEYWATLWPLSTKGRPRKLEGRRYLCIEWIISPTRHSAFSLCVACNRHAACRCQDSSLVASAKHSACNTLLNSFDGPEYYTRHSYLLPHTILWIDHLARRVDGRRTYLWGFYQISFLGALWGCIAIKPAPVLQSFHLFLLFLLHVEHMPVSVSALFQIQNTYFFMSDCPHVCVCMHNAAPQSVRRFSKGVFKLWKDKEHTQVQDRFGMPGKRQPPTPIFHCPDYTPRGSRWMLLSVAQQEL